MIVNITTGPNGEFARHHLMVTLAPILLDPEIVNAHVTGKIPILHNLTRKDSTYMSRLNTGNFSNFDF